MGFSESTFLPVETWSFWNYLTPGGMDAEKVSKFLRNSQGIKPGQSMLSFSFPTPEVSRAKY